LPATIAAFTERLMPGRPGQAGASDAGVLNYIDSGRLGRLRRSFRIFYRRGLTQLDAYCPQGPNSGPFQRLSAAQQDEVIAALEESKATGFTLATAQILQATLRTHTMEGMFADPLYGG